MMWVQKGLFQRPIGKYGGAAQLLALKVAGWIIAVGYSPPGKEGDMGRCIRTMQTEVPGRKPIIAMGDSNEEKGESIDACWRTLGLSIVTQNKPGESTRLSSTKK